MIFIREDIPATLKSIENPPIEAFFVELTVKKKEVASKLQLQQS